MMFNTLLLLLFLGFFESFPSKESISLPWIGVMLSLYYKVGVDDGALKCVGSDIA